ncbi:MAG TPA: signal peptidase II [Candidatus Limnocylindria bacterium]|nr:signal peptidase II [Candidatus Limnocylindria bacterium]
MESSEQKKYLSENKQKKEKVLIGSFFFLFLILVAFDQLVKNFANNIFKNSQFAFSLPVPIGLIYVIYICVLVAMVNYVLKNYRKFSLVAGLAWVLIFAGAISNIAERIFTGYVKDFIYITFMKWTGVYNLADFFIIAGIILLLIPISKLNNKPYDI